MAGKLHWFFPDAEIPPMGADAQLFGHESLIVLNAGTQAAHLHITLYWTDRAPTTGLSLTVEAGRVHCERATERDGFLGVRIPTGEQYALGLESDAPIIAQYGRLDMRTGNMAFYTTPGYGE
ncbi:MAG: sensory rhodopsin transducer [Clostridia bacterium]